MIAEPFGWRISRRRMSLVDRILKDSKKAERKKKGNDETEKLEWEAEVLVWDKIQKQKKEQDLDVSPQVIVVKGCKDQRIWGITKLSPCWPEISSAITPAWNKAHDVSSFKRSYSWISFLWRCE